MVMKKDYYIVVALGCIDGLCARDRNPSGREFFC